MEKEENSPNRLDNFGSDNFIQRMETLQKKREKDQINFQELVRSIKESERIIKATADHHINNAKTLGKAKLEDAVCVQFILGGLSLNHAPYSIGVLSAPFPKSILRVSTYPLAVRIEENPAFPLFLIATDGNLNNEDFLFQNKLEGHLKRLVKPYAWVPQSIIEQYSNWNRTK